LLLLHLLINVGLLLPVLLPIILELLQLALQEQERLNPQRILQKGWQGFALSSIVQIKLLHK
jgi:hypothetical protein